LAGKIVAPLLDERPKRIALAAPTLNGARAADALEAPLAAVLAADFALPGFKSGSNADKRRGVDPRPSKSCTPTPKDAGCSPTRCTSPHAKNRA
ncbi:MAG: hypothetical protein ACJ8KA_05050, partial [Sulfurifustis sp.]